MLKNTLKRQKPKKNANNAQKKSLLDNTVYIKHICILNSIVSSIPEKEASTL